MTLITKKIKVGIVQQRKGKELGREYKVHAKRLLNQKYHFPPKLQ